MLFGKKKKKNTRDRLVPKVAIDIGTEYVKSVVFLVEGREVQVYGYDRTKQNVSAMSGAYILNLAEVVDSVDRSLGKAMGQAEEILQQKLTLPETVILGIAGELVHGATIIVHLEREKPDSQITQKELSNIIDQVKEYSFQSTVSEIASELGVDSDILEEIDTHINSVYIDGSRVTNPLKFKGKNVSYKVFSTFAPKVHVDSIKQVANDLSISNQLVLVEPYALSMSLKGIRRENSGAIFIDIGGGTTDIAVVDSGDIVGTRMFAMGGRIFTKRLQKDLGLEYQEAEDIKLKYSDGKLTSDEQLKVSKSISKDISVWLNAVQVALESFEDLEEYPTEIYLCGGGALLPEIQEGLISYPWKKYLNIPKFPTVSFFFPNKVSQVVDKTKSAVLPVDVTPLALARMSLDYE